MPVLGAKLYIIYLMDVFMSSRLLTASSRHRCTVCSSVLSRTKNSSAQMYFSRPLLSPATQGMSNGTVTPDVRTTNNAPRITGKEDSRKQLAETHPAKYK